jgi:CDP-glucose 4,6-dehydratase
MSLQPFNFSTFQLKNTFQNKKVFLTGHTGFKGSWLCEWLLSLGAEVTGFSLPQHSTTPSLFDQLGLAERIDDRRGDIREGALVKRTLLEVRPDFVFHLAAQPLVRLSYRTPLETWETNVLGTIHVLEALRELNRGKVERLKGNEIQSTSQPFNPSRHGVVVAIFITTDKVYENREWLHGYRECDPLGGHDPYSSSKAAAEIAIASWRKSYFTHDVEPGKGGEVEGSESSSAVQPFNRSTNIGTDLLMASARAGNVIGGGDWAEDRIVPDCIRSLKRGEAIPVRNKVSTRPWQHVLEPLSGYLLLAARLASSVEESKGGNVDGIESRSTVRPFIPSCAELCSAFNFGPHLESNRTVAELVDEVLKHWPGRWVDQSDPHAPHEAGKLNLATDKAFHTLGWQPRWDFATTIEKTVAWYRAAEQGADPAELTRRQIREYNGGI